jgi:hypothetical protein
MTWRQPVASPVKRYMKTGELNAIDFLLKKYRSIRDAARLKPAILMSEKMASTGEKTYT